jgi:protein TonB
MRIVIANSVSAVVHVAALATLAYYSPIDRWAVEYTVARGAPLVVEFSPPSVEAGQSVTVDLPLPIEPAEFVPTQASHDLPPIDAVQTARQPLEHREPEPLPLVSELPETEAALAAVASPQSRFEPTPAQPAESRPAAARRQPKAVLEVERASAATMTLQAPTAIGAQVDEPPRKLPLNPPPSYPRQSLLAGEQGRVLIKTAVRADGTVAAVAIDQTSGWRLLDEAALAAVRGWRFSPARRGGQAVAYDVIVPVRFTIRRG